MRFAALGRTHLLYDAIEACVAAGHECVAIATAAPAPEYLRTEADFRDLAARLGCVFLDCGSRLDGEERGVLARSQADIAISVNWPVILPQETRELFPHGVLNAHAGDLPRYRGNACPNWAMLQGESQVVVVVHAMVDDLDAGPVLLRREFPLDERTYIDDVYAFLERAVPELFVQALTAIAAGSVRWEPQPDDPALALRCLARRPEDGLIGWDRPAVELARLVRASAEPLAGAFAYLDGRRITIWRARAEAAVGLLGVPGQVAAVRPSGEVAVLTGDGVLVIETVEVEALDGVVGSTAAGRRAAGDVIRSSRQRFDGPAAALLRLQARVSALEAVALAVEAAVRPPVS